MCENALRRPFGGPIVHREQLHHLARARDRGIGVRIVRDNVPVGALLHNWQRLTFPNAGPIVNVEAVEGRFYFHAARTDVFDRQITALSDLAYSAEESSALLRHPTIT
ncbi:hypothetical protein BLA60_20940 [Actinophytocola xinjiangensis]|uniref:DUF5753 domain-containing protein n=1 Tax=Actinophytocola xinjiangensis TaxID=485602 RepID=A0A7Z0WLI9_9PSEU|nr:hypothetical protein BLA60_20940 [Actinophytocola xinjiangensis]